MFHLYSQLLCVQSLYRRGGILLNCLEIKECAGTLYLFITLTDFIRKTSLELNIPYIIKMHPHVPKRITLSQVTRNVSDWIHWGVKSGSVNFSLRWWRRRSKSHTFSCRESIRAMGHLLLINICELRLFDWVTDWQMKQRWENRNVWSKDLKKEQTLFSVNKYYAQWKLCIEKDWDLCYKTLIIHKFEERISMMSIFL